MRFPRVLLAVPLIAAGAFLPALGHAPAKAPAGTVGMAHETFTTDQIAIHRGDTLRFVNDSRYLHTIGPGHNGTLVTGGGEPMHRRVLMEEGDSYTTPPFNQPGTYAFACSLHPDMNLKVIVTR
jgi:plastocyanin